MTRILTHVRRNLVGYIALFVALGGTSYAAMTISGAQIRNRTINAIKFDPHTIVPLFAPGSSSTKAVIAQAGRAQQPGQVPPLTR